MNYINFFKLLTIGLCFLTACSTESGHKQEGHNVEHASHDEDHESGIHLTRKQIEAMDIQFGSFSSIKIKDFVKATGVIGLPPNALAAVNAQAPGYIRNSNKLVAGDYVKKGSILAYLENPEFIQQQQQYLELLAALAFEEKELARQQSLLKANAGIEKSVQKLESTVAIKQAQKKGLAQQLKYLGIDVTKLTMDNMKQKVPIYAPMTGYITSIRLHNGLYATPAIPLLTIADDRHLHLELDVFEKDIAQVKEGQAISYVAPALGNQIYEGEVHVIGRAFNDQNKTVRVHGHLENGQPRFIQDLFVEAKIWLNDQVVQALPEQAVIKDGVSAYIYVASPTEKEEVKFEAIKVISGTTTDGYTAIKLIDRLPEGAEIVTKGTYYVYAQSKAGVLQHEH
ncbi:MAG: efflux RND transporter periplasmic adaptor subunit [Flammeovirgaceae bacterium]